MYGWQNEAGEPIMSGEAWRFEQALDAEYAEQRYLDDDEFFEADYDEDDFEDQDDYDPREDFGYFGDEAFMGE